MATKKLARQLGIIRSISKPSPGSLSRRQPKHRQLFDYLIVIDFESTCWKDNRKCQEIIEFPAVLLNTSNGDIETEFHTYVQPQEHPTLSEFCTELTGIKQNQVDEGVPLHICLSQFSKWIQKIQKEKNIIFSSARSSCAAAEEKLCAFVTWSDWDLGICLYYECKRKQLRKPEVLNSWIDLRATYKNFYSRKPQGLNGALKDVGIIFEGREHSGLDDSRNTARLAWRMVCDGCVMQITKSLDKAPPLKSSVARSVGEEPPDGCPLGGSSVDNTDLEGSKNRAAAETRQQEQEVASIRWRDDAPGPSRSSRKTNEHYNNQHTGRLNSPLGCFQPPGYKPLGLQSSEGNGHLLSNSSAHNQGLLLVPTTLPTVNVYEADVSTTADCLSLLADWEDVAIVPEWEGDPISEASWLKGYPSNQSSLMAKERENTNRSNGANQGGEAVVETSLRKVLSKAVVYKSPNTTIYNAGSAPHKRSDSSAFKLPVAKANATSADASNRNHLAGSAEGLKRKSSSPKAYLPAKKPPFEIHEDRRPTSSRFLPPRADSPSASPGVLSCSSNSSFRAAEHGRVTPPLCQCGRRARKLHVVNGGPHQGQAFYSCPIRKPEGKKGCSYFRWELSLLQELVALPASASKVAGLKRPQTSGSSQRNKLKCLGLRPSMRT